MASIWVTSEYFAITRLLLKNILLLSGFLRNYQDQILVSKKYKMEKVINYKKELYLFSKFFLIFFLHFRSSSKGCEKHKEHIFSCFFGILFFDKGKRVNFYTYSCVLQLFCNFFFGGMWPISGWCWSTQRCWPGSRMRQLGTGSPQGYPVPVCMSPDNAIRMQSYP